MAVLHEIPVDCSMKELAVKVIDIYSEHGARDPVPEWYGSMLNWYHDLRHADVETDEMPMLMLRTEYFLGENHDWDEE